MQAYKKKPTRRARFLAGINQVTPWTQFEQLIEPFYPEVTGAGRRPIGIACMLRMYVAQQCFGLSEFAATTLSAPCRPHQTKTPRDNRGVLFGACYSMRGWLSYAPPACTRWYGYRLRSHRPGSRTAAPGWCGDWLRSRSQGGLLSARCPMCCP